MPDLTAQYIRELGAAAALADANVMPVDQGGDAKKVTLTTLRTYTQIGLGAAALSNNFSDLSNKPTTLSGYGITDAYPLVGNPSGFLTSAPVSSVFGRTGAVVAALNDYTWAQIDKTTSSLADLATRSASDLNSGTLAAARGGAGTISGILKANGSGVVSAAVAGTDYLSGNQTITLSGDVSGSGSTAITTTIGAGVVTNAMLAGSIANAKLSNSAITIAGTSTSLGGSITLDTITGLSSTGLLKRTAANTLVIATAGTDYLASVRLDQVLDPTGNKNFAHANTTLTHTFGAATGAGVDMVTLTDTTSNTGTGDVLMVFTASGSAARPITITAGGMVNGVQMNTSGALAAIGSGAITATTAATLATARTINGTSFDGSGNIIVTAAAGTLTGTTLNATVVSSSLTSLGTITSGGLGAGAVIGGVTMTLGSDADGDIYYRASNVLTRLPKGAALQGLRMNAGATAPEWAAITASFIVGTTAVTSGTGGRFLYETTGNLVGEISTLTSDGTIVTFSPTVTTGSGATAGLNANANSLTTGTAFNFASSSVTSGTIFNIASTSTAGASSTLTALNIAVSGANGTTAQTVTGAKISVTNTNATSGTNVALTLTASGATTANTALNVTAGQSLFADGTQALPGMSFGSEPSSGFYRSGTGIINFTNQNTRIILFLASQLGLANGYNLAWYSAGFGGQDAFFGKKTGSAATFLFGASDVNGAPVAQTRLVQNAVTGSNLAGAAATTEIASLGTSQGVPGRYHIQTGGMIAASGTTQQTAIDRLVIGATKVLTNNTVTTIVNVTDASNTIASGIVEYTVEVFDGTDLQIETGIFAYQVTNKGGTIANNTITTPGASGVGVTSNFPKNVTTSGTLAVTFAISAANPALLSVNANSSLTPSTGYPRISYTIRNYTQQAIAVQ